MLEYQISVVLATINDGVVGALGAPWWVYVLYTVVVCHITLIAVTLFLHRSKAHLAVTFVKPVDHFFRFWLWLTTGMCTSEWVAVHRKHHATVETEEDPHSPVTEGINKVLFSGTELYRRETRKRETIEKFAHDIPMDYLERIVYAGPYNRWGIFLQLSINIALFGFIGVSIWAVQMLCIPFLAAGVINGIGHYWGYRNFETPDNSRNVVPWGIIIVGEELHNNHHAYPASAKFSLKPWEFDFGWLYLVVFRVLGLARINRLAPRPKYDSSKSTLENDTIRAIIRSRMHVTAGYTKRVLMPLLSEARRRIDTHPGLVSKLNEVREQLKSRQHGEVAPELPEDSKLEDLRRGIDFRKRLIAIWETTHASQERLYEAMRDWCRDAEASGIESLRHFAQTLKGYSLSYQWH